MSIYRAILCGQVLPNAEKLIGQLFTVQMDNDPKHTAQTSQFLKAKIQWPSEPADLSLTEHAF